MTKNILFAIAIFFILPFSPVNARTFNPNNVLSDRDLFDFASMSLGKIQTFLERKGGTLGAYVTTGISNLEQKASEIIHDASQLYQMNPRVILTTLQKEQSLVTDPDPIQGQYDWATGFGVCDTCSKDDPQIQKFKGFTNQVHWTAKRLRQYYEEPLNFRHQVGKTYLIDGVSVTPINRATAGQYNYTPHIHGVKSFWEIWNRWFTKSYPDGSLIQEEGQRLVYLIQNGKKRPFKNRIAFLTNYDTKDIVTVSRNDIDAYEDDIPIQFTDNTLLKRSDGTVFVVHGGKKRGIVSFKVFRQLGYNPEEVIPANDKDLQTLPDGEPITEESVYPTGILLQSRQTGGISYIEDGVRHSIWSKEILKSRFKHRTATVVEQEEIDVYSKGNPVQFREGSLVTAEEDSRVYIISNSEKRPFKNKAVFDALGYKWKNILVTSPEALVIHPTGKVIDIN